MPVIGVVGEQKAKPTQHSVRERRELGLTPDLLACHSTQNLCTERLMLYYLPASSSLQPKKNKQSMVMKHVTGSEAEGLLESHCSTIISNQNEPLNRLDMFLYYANYEKLTEIEFGLVMKHVIDSVRDVAIVGSGPLPLSSLVLARKYLTDAVFVNYDLDSAATVMARKLVEADSSFK